MSEEKKVDEAEEAAIQAYMADDTAIDKEAWQDYIKLRYKEVCVEYERLVANRMEFEQQKREDLLDKLHPHFRNNHKARVWAVQQSRVAGIPIEDKYVK